MMCTGGEQRNRNKGLVRVSGDFEENPLTRPLGASATPELLEKEEESKKAEKEGETTKREEEKENDLKDKGTDKKINIRLRNNTYTQRSRTSHKLKTKSFKRPTYCALCDGLLWGFSEQVASIKL